MRTIYALRARLDPIADALSSGLKALARDTRRRPHPKDDTLPDDPAWHAALVSDHPPKITSDQ